jgi:hypothetical protein
VLILRCPRVRCAHPGLLPVALRARGPPILTVPCQALSQFSRCRARLCHNQALSPSAPCQICTVSGAVTILSQSRISRKARKARKGEIACWLTLSLCAVFGSGRRGSGSRGITIRQRSIPDQPPCTASPADRRVRDGGHRHGGCDSKRLFALRPLGGRRRCGLSGLVQMRLKAAPAEGLVGAGAAHHELLLAGDEAQGES